ncbi:MAG: hypothetical protein ACTSP1_07755 [Candidatus Freyarchaeota archaeon]
MKTIKNIQSLDTDVVEYVARGFLDCSLDLSTRDTPDLTEFIPIARWVCFPLSCLFVVERKEGVPFGIEV